MLLKGLGKRAGGVGSWETGLAAERRFLIDSVGIDSASSRWPTVWTRHQNLVSPLAFTRILRFIRSHPRARRFWPAAAGGQAGCRSRFVGTQPPAAFARRTGASAA
jgi:hypothetical protein